MSGGQIKGKSVPFFEGIPFGVYDVLLPNSDGHFRLEQEMIVTEMINGEKLPR